MEDIDISIRDYVEASSEAARRTRRVTVVLMIATVLMFSGLSNSLQGNWKRARLQALEDVNSEYVRARLGTPPQNSEAHTLYLTRYSQLYSAALKDYTENAYTIRIPFFGIVIDINDLGSIGGLALALILVLYRTSLTRELDNLRLSFEGAQAQNGLRTLYYMLAMQQVLTFPNIDGRDRSKFMEMAPKLLLFAPVLIYLMICVYDFYTLSFGLLLSSQAGVLVVQEVFYLAIVVAMSLMSLKKLRQIDKIWDHYWNIMREQRPDSTLADCSNLDARQLVGPLQHESVQKINDASKV
jgi:hypothetical protein